METTCYLSYVVSLRNMYGLNTDKDTLQGFENAQIRSVCTNDIQWHDMKWYGKFDMA
jgi:hypothetical protein